jgi:glycosyltransferase involved in cell wall biosynthesis
MPGFLNLFSETDSLFEYLSKGWILCNTSAKEALPLSFLEGAAHQCAILSHVNPDGFASEMGYHAYDEDFEKGLDWLIKDDNWKRCGMNGYEYVRQNHEMENVIDAHIEVYKQYSN